MTMTIFILSCADKHPDRGKSTTFSENQLLLPHCATPICRMNIIIKLQLKKTAAI